MGLYPRAIEAALVGIPRGPNSNVYLVDPANGDDDAPGDRWTQPLASLTAAYAKCTMNQNDVVLYLGGATGLTLSAALVWAKGYTHLVGLCAPTRVGQRARIFQLSTLTAASPLISVTGSGCVFKNLYVFQGVADATSLINVEVTGGRNVFDNVHFAGGGHATQAVDGGASLSLNGAAECLFKNCTIGVDTIAAATGMAGVLVDGDAKRCIFEGCNFTMYAGNAGAKFVEVVDSAGFDRYLIFRDCLFINDAVGYTMTEAFTVPGGMGSQTHRIILQNCAAVGVGDWEDNDRGIVFAAMGTYTAGGNSGLMETVAAA